MCTRLSEREIDGQHEAGEGGHVVPMQLLALKQQVGNECEDHQRHHFLYHFELDERERSAVADEADAVGRHLGAVFEESDSPRKQDDSDEGPRGGYVHLLQTQVTVPSECHEDVGDDQQQNCVKSIHVRSKFRQS